MQLDLQDLQTFVEVADAAGVSAAARRLGLSKSIVSRRLLRLEHVLGVQLLARTTRGAALTEAGTTFREYAARVSAELRAGLEAVMPNGELRGRIRIAAPLSFGSQFALLFSEFARRHPQLHIQADYSDRFVDLVSEGYDCAIRVGHLRDSNLMARKIGPGYAKIVASPDYIRQHGAPETPDDLPAHEALMQGAETWRLMDGDKEIQARPQGRFKSDNGVALAAAAVVGLGIALLPDGLVKAWPADALTPVMTRFPPAPGGFYVVRPPGHHQSRTVRALTDLLVERFKGAVAQQDIRSRLRREST